MPDKSDFPKWVSQGLQGYLHCDTDETGATYYYGFMHPSGRWYIIAHVSGGSGSSRYTKGESAYTTAWTGRAALSYGYPNQKFEG